MMKIIEKIIDWATGTIAFYAVGLAIASFIKWDWQLPFSTAPDRIWFVLCGMAAAGMMAADEK